MELFWPNQLSVIESYCVIFALSWKPHQTFLMCAVCDDRYPHELLCLLDKPSVAMLWTRYTLWIPVYILSAATEGD